MTNQEKTSINNKRLKVIHILQSAGGVAEYIKDLLSNIDSNKYENILIVSNDYKENEKILKQKCKKIIYVDMIREINFKKDFRAIVEIKKILREEKPEILYLHSSKAGALGRIAALLNRKVQIIYNAHGWYFNADIGKKKKKIFQLIEKILAYRTNKIITISKSEYDSAIDNRVCKKDKLVLIENGIDIEKYADYQVYREKTREKYGIREEDTVVGIVGRVSEQKDPITSIKSAVELIKQNQNIYFMFVGSGDLEQEVMKIAKENKIDSNIIITGWVNDVKSYISAFDIAMLPSKWEGFGLAILEYMICKKPIIVTKIGGIADILDNPASAFFVEKENYKDIEKKIKDLIYNGKDITNMVEMNYERCKARFSIKRVAMQTEQVFQEVIGSKRRK